MRWVWVLSIKFLRYSHFYQFVHFNFVHSSRFSETTALCCKNISIMPAYCLMLQIYLLCSKLCWHNPTDPTICCVPIGLVSTLMCNYIYGFWRKAWLLNIVLFCWGIISEGCTWVFLCCELYMYIVGGGSGFLLLFLSVNGTLYFSFSEWKIEFLLFVSYAGKYVYTTYNDGLKTFTRKICNIDFFWKFYHWKIMI